MSISYKNLIGKIIKAKEFEIPSARTFTSSEKLPRYRHTPFSDEETALRAANKAKQSKRASATIKKLNADPEFAKKNSARRTKMNLDPEFAKASSERMRKLHADPEFAKAHKERLAKLNSDPEFKKQNAERIRKLNADPEFIRKNREAISVAQKKRWAQFRANKSNEP